MLGGPAAGNNVLPARETPATLPSGARLAVDTAGQTVLLFEQEWSCNFFAERNPKIALATLPPRAPLVAAGQG